jgi:hypothetical protein
MGGCQVIIWKAWLWTIIGNVFGERHASRTLKTSLNRSSLTLHTFSVALTSQVVDPVDPSFPSFPYQLCRLEPREPSPVPRICILLMFKLQIWLVFGKSITTDKTSLHPYINIGVYPRQMSQWLYSFIFHVLTAEQEMKYRWFTNPPSYSLCTYWNAWCYYWTFVLHKESICRSYMELLWNTFTAILLNVEPDNPITLLFYATNRNKKEISNSERMMRFWNETTPDLFHDKRGTE